jgi:AraC family transcriptional regulator
VKPDTRSYYVERVQHVVEHIAVHLDEALDLQRLAAEAGLSPFHFHRVFRGMVGETPVELIRRLRMERAAWQLFKTANSVTQIAFDAGYETHEAFTRAFRLCYGTSPTRFKQRRYPRIQLAASCGIHFDAAGRVGAIVPRDSGGEIMNVEIKDMPALRVGTVRHIGPYNQISQAFERLGAVAGPAGLFRYPQAAMLGLFHDDPDSTPPEQLRSDAAIVVPPDIPLPPELVEQKIPGGRYATTLHVGPYELLGDTWTRFMGEWLPASGHRLGPGVSYEIYVNNPTNARPEELETELYVPIV